MRIVQVNWARIWDGATGGGGVNGYCQALSLELIRRGHEVISLCGGTAYKRSGRFGSGIAPCEVRRHPDWLGIKVFEVFNSPVLAPSLAQFRAPMGEVSAPELEREVGRLFDALRADVVHFHNIEGFSVGCVEAARRSGAGVVFSLHNYQTICPQVYLMQGHRRPCFDAENGHKCATCVEAEDPGEEKRRRARAGFEGPKAYVPVTVTKPRETMGTWRRLGSELLGLAGGRDDESAESPEGDASRPLTTLPVHDPFLIGGEDDRGKAPLLRREMEPRRLVTPDDPDWRPLENDASADPPSDKPKNEYGHRRDAMIGMLSSCDRVLAVSDFVRDKFKAMGVVSARIETMHIGTRVNEVASRHRELVFAPPPLTSEDASRPVRLVFIGFNHYYKGLGMLADSLELLTPEYLRRIDLHISSLGGELIEYRFRRLEPRLAKLTYHLGYEQHDIPWICGGKDLGLVPSVWWDNGPQTVLEFNACGVPVLAPRLGGIPDFVEDGVNGLLHRGNDRFDLARRLAWVLDHPSELAALRANVRPPIGMADHAGVMEQVYGQCVSSRTPDKEAGSDPP